MKTMELKLIGAKKFNSKIKIDKKMDSLPNMVSEEKLKKEKRFYLI